MIPQELIDYNDQRLRLVIQNQIKSAAVGQSEMFIKGIDMYLDDAPELRREYAQSYADLLVQNAESLNLKNVYKLIENLNVETLAIMYCLENIVFVGLDTNYSDFKPALYTNNMNLLGTLFSNGLLDCTEQELIELADKFRGKRRTMLREAKFTAVRLDVSKYTKDGDVQYKPVLPNYMELLYGERFIFVPVQAYFDIARFFQSNTKPFRITYEDYANNVTKESVVTMQADVLKQVMPPELYDKRYELHESIGFNSVNLKLVAWDLEAQYTRTGLRTFGAEVLSKVELIEPSQVDTSLLMVGVELGFMFREIILSKSVEELKTFNAMDLSTAKGRTAYAMLLEFERSSSTKQLYYAMLTNPQIFGDIKNQLPHYREKYKFLTEGVTVDLPYEPLERKNVLRELASKGVVEFMYQNKKGELSVKKMTFMPEVLDLTLGFDYIEKFETNRTKLRTLYDYIDKNKITNTVTKQQLAVRYDVESLLDFNMYYSSDVEHTLEAIEDAMIAQEEENYTLATPVIRLKSTKARNKYSFIQAINTENIQSAITFYDCSVLKTMN